MTQKNITRSDVEALENATSILQREEQKIKGINLPGGPTEKARALTDTAEDVYIHDKLDAGIRRKAKTAVDDAARTIQREEAKS